jgi:hypothetical protein
MVTETKPKIAVVLNAFKRTKHLRAQLDAIEAQSIPPESIYVWQNKGEEIAPDLKERFVLAECSANLGVWARFAFALNLDAEYICLFDDDTIPGERWFENCLNTMETHEGLMGTRGLRFLSDKRYHPFDSFGWGDPNESTVEVDIVGHAWFFKREWLATFWSELPPKDASKIAGEDIHFSYMLQKRLGLGTYVPPHPVDDKSLWGSLPESGEAIGTDEAAIHKNDGALSRFDIAFQYYVENGFELCLSSAERRNRGIVVGSGVRNNALVKSIIKKDGILKRVGKWFVSKLEKLGLHI